MYLYKLHIDTIKLSRFGVRCNGLASIKTDELTKDVDEKSAENIVALVHPPQLVLFPQISG